MEVEHVEVQTNPFIDHGTYSLPGELGNTRIRTYGTERSKR
jgi:hypothetical protein